MGLPFCRITALTVSVISLAEMTDTVSAVILQNGRPTGRVYRDSVEAYALRVLRGPKTSDRLRTVIVDMLNYGAAAQKKFGYAPTVPANSRLTPQEQKLASVPVTPENVREKGPKYYGTNLNLGSSMALTLFFKNITPDMHATVTYTKHTGEKRELEISGDQFVKFNSSVYGIRVSTLVVADAYQPVSVTVYDARGREVASAVDSISGYVARAESLGQLGTDILKFSEAARLYFAER